MKILITGASGYVGTKLVQKLLEQRHTLHLLLRNPDRSPYFRTNGIKLFTGDIRNTKSIHVAMEGCDQVYHLAALAKVWVKDPSSYFKTNLLGTKNVLDSAVYFGISKIVFCSTAGVFGPSIYQDIDENSIRLYDFSNEYESSKAMAESLIRQYIIKHRLNIVITSPTRVYGPCDYHKPTNVNFMIKRYLERKWRIIPGDGTKIGNYVFIDDTVNGLIQAMDLGECGETYILSGENHSIGSFFRTLKNASGINVTMIQIPFWLIRIYVHFQYFIALLLRKDPLITPKWIHKVNSDWKVSTKRTQIELGVEKTSLDIGLAATVKWLYSHKINS